MEILKKILELLSKFLETYNNKKVEKEEIKNLEIVNNKKIKNKLNSVKKNDIKPPKKDDFFNDDSW